MTSATSQRFKLATAVRHRLEPSPTLYINERVNAMWASGETVYHLGFGESRFPVHPHIRAALSENAHQKSYLAGLGLQELRAAAANFYSRKLGFDVKTEQLIIGPGSKPLYFILQMALDADLLLPTPSWVSYGPQAQLLHKPVYQIPSDADANYPLTIDAIDATMHQSDNPAKILLLNSPNNPTSQMFKPDFLEQLANYCRDNNVIVLSDEIYSLVPHGHREHVSIARYYPEGTVVLGGVSKHLSLGGWRLGTAILPDSEEGRTLMRALRIIASELWSSPTGPVQYAAVVAYSDEDDIDAYIDECAAIHAIRTQYLWQKLSDAGVPCAQPDGGFYVFPTFNRWRSSLAKLGITTSPELARYLLETYQISSLPGTAFGVDAYELSLRFASSYLDMETDDKAQRLLDLYRANPDPTKLMAEHHPNTQEAVHRLCTFVQGL